jgi:hypothetical protein
VITAAAQTAWHERRYWPLAVGAALVFGAGGYDLGWRAAQALASMGTALSAHVPMAFPALNPWHTIMAGPWILGFAILLLVIGALAVICQGGLIFALGAAREGKAPTLHQAFNAGVRSLWKVLALDAALLGAIWLLRFFVALALSLALETMTPGAKALYAASFVFFGILQFVGFILLIFTLHRAVLHRDSIASAFPRAYALLKRHWLVAGETFLLLLASALGVSIFAFGAVFLMTIPAFFGYLLALALGSPALFALATWFIVLTTGLILFGATAFLTQLQYGVWTELWTRIAEGRATPKLHRLHAQITR